MWTLVCFLIFKKMAEIRNFVVTLSGERQRSPGQYNLWDLEESTWRKMPTPAFPKSLHLRESSKKKKKNHLLRLSGKWLLFSFQGGHQPGQPPTLPQIDTVHFLVHMKMSPFYTFLQVFAQVPKPDQHSCLIKCHFANWCLTDFLPKGSSTFWEAILITTVLAPKNIQNF